MIFIIDFIYVATIYVIPIIYVTCVYIISFNPEPFVLDIITIIL